MLKTLTLTTSTCKHFWVKCQLYIKEKKNCPVTELSGGEGGVTGREFQRLLGGGQAEDSGALTFLV